MDRADESIAVHLPPKEHSVTQEKIISDNVDLRTVANLSSAYSASRISQNALKENLLPQTHFAIPHGLPSLHTSHSSSIRSLFIRRAPT